MRYILFAAFGFFCAAMLMSHLTYAAGNVLLPSSTGSAAPAPNLGLAPTPAAPAAEPETPQALSVGSALPADASTPSGALPQTPPAQNLNAIAAGAVSSISPDAAKKLPAGQFPTTVIHQPDISSFFSTPNPDLPSTIAIVLDGKSYFGANDIQQLSTKLGLTRDQVTSQCYLSTQGMVQTDQGSYMIYGMTSPQVSVNYAGKITNYLMSVVASCTANNLPPGSGVLTETKGRYIIPLQGVSCTPPNRQVSQLTITYTGTASSTCTYR